MSSRWRVSVIVEPSKAKIHTKNLRQESQWDKHELLKTITCTLKEIYFSRKETSSDGWVKLVQFYTPILIFTHWKVSGWKVTCALLWELFTFLTRYFSFICCSIFKGKRLSQLQAKLLTLSHSEVLDNENVVSIPIMVVGDYRRNMT